MARAAVASVLLSLFFVVVYGGTNWFTAQRPPSSVGTWYFAWELAVIPYVPLLIVPYMSIDLFFFTAPFLCRDKREMRVFAQRVVFSVLMAAAFFLLMPLKLAWPERPPVGGWFGGFVEACCRAPFLMEYPHNLFPSLHITLCMILADLYARHTRGLVRAVVCAWFTLIGLSAVLTYQHQVVDVLGGAGLAVIAFYVCRGGPRASGGTKNARIALYYGLGAGALLALAWATWPWGSVLLWPAIGLGIATAGYCGLGPGIYRKNGGVLPVSTRLVLGPLLLGQYLSLLYYRRQCRRWDEVVPGLLMGGRLSEAEAAEAVRQGVTAVLDLTAELSEVPALRAVRYCNLPILDLTHPTMEQMRAGAQVIAGEIVRGTVYVHCKIGYSRSAAIVGAYLLHSGWMATAEEVVEHLRRIRPSIIVRSEALAALRAFAMARGNRGPIAHSIIGTLFE
jgi:protein-tyrosine phosphatase